MQTPKYECKKYYDIINTGLASSSMSKRNMTTKEKKKTRKWKFAELIEKFDKNFITLKNNAE